MKLEHMQALLDDFCIPLQLASGSSQDHTNTSDKVRAHRYCIYTVMLLFFEWVYKVKGPILQTHTHTQMHAHTCMHTHATRVHAHTHTLQKQPAPSSTATTTIPTCSTISSTSIRPLTTRPVGRPRIHSCNYLPQLTFPAGKILVNKEGMDHWSHIFHQRLCVLYIMVLNASLIVDCEYNTQNNTYM